MPAIIGESMVPSSSRATAQPFTVTSWSRKGTTSGMNRIEPSSSTAIGPAVSP